MPLPRSFPPADDGADLRTAIALTPVDGALPVVSWLGPTRGAETGELTEADGFSVVEHGPGMPLLGEHARGRFTRPHLRGHRLRSADVAETGGAWSTWFRPVAEEHDDRRLVVTAVDEDAGLGLVVELETVAGGSLRGRCTVTNQGPGDYVVDGLEVVLPLPDDHVELLDFTGRHERERSPQRHTITDGLWLREGLGGRPGLDSATMVVAGTPGFGTTHGRVVGVHVAWSGNSVLRVERTAASGTTIGGGEHLLPGEVTLPPEASYATPWVYFAAADDGLDGLAAAWHTYQRSLDAHPRIQPVVLNVWEAVYFDHDLDRLREHRRPGRPGRRRAVRARRRLVPRPARRHRRPRRLVGRRERLARRAEPADRPRRRAGHGVRALVRARDGQPRLRPLPPAPRLDPARRVTAPPCCTVTSWCST